MKLVLVTSLIFCFVCSAQNPKFIGTWRENEAKRQIGAGVPLRFQRSASGATEELRGPEGKPLVQPVHFGNKAYAVDNSRNTIEWRQADANHFERRLYENGNLLTIRRIAISVDGKTLTEATERTPADVTTVVFKRISGDSQGLIGIWQAASTNTTKPAALKVTALGPNGLRLTDDRDVIENLSFDGKPTATTGPAVISGTMTAAKLINTTRIEVTNSRDGVVAGTVIIDLSSDGKTLTQTSKPASGGQPSITVYDRQ
jgi:hypothetical protein